MPATRSTTALRACPAGLTIGAATGLISGTPTTSGVSNVTVTVSDGQLDGEATFSWTLLPADSFVDTTVADFGAGSHSGTYVTDTAGGAVILAPTVASEFSGSSLPAGWSAKASPWTTGGTSSVTGGRLSVDGTMVGTTATFGPGRSLEFVATFGATGSQHVGFVGDLNFNNPWVIVSTGSNGATVSARSNSNTTGISLGTGLLGSEHRFRIDWTAAGFEFFVDGATTPAATLPAVATSMLVGVSDFTAGGPALSVDWLRMTPYATGGTFTSRVFGAGTNAEWGFLGYDAKVPAGTSLALEVRTGDTATPDGDWSAVDRGWRTAARSRPPRRSRSTEPPSPQRSLGHAGARGGPPLLHRWRSGREPSAGRHEPRSADRHRRRHGQPRHRRHRSRWRHADLSAPPDFPAAWPSTLPTGIISGTLSAAGDLQRHGHRLRRRPGAARRSSRGR